MVCTRIRENGAVSSSVNSAFPPDGFTASWSAFESDHGEHLSLQWDNEAWTASVRLDGERVEFVIRLSPLWQVRQFLLFRDLEEPDLWLGTDGRGAWGEINGAHRRELRGATDLTVARDGASLSAFVHTIPIRRIPVDVGGSFDARVVEVDVETLAVELVLRTYRRVDTAVWEVAQHGRVTELTVDEFALATEVGGSYVRTT